MSSHCQKISSCSPQVGGYSTLSTLVLIFNLLILFSVAKNKYLHYTTHYVMVTLALRFVLYIGCIDFVESLDGLKQNDSNVPAINFSARNLLRVALTLWLVFMAKLVQTPWLLK